MSVNSKDKIGGGTVRRVQISSGRRLKEVTSRGGLFGSDIRVGISGAVRGKILIPTWQSVVGLSARRGNEYKVGYRDQKYLVYRVYDNVYDAARAAYRILYEKYGLTYPFGELSGLKRAGEALKQYNFLAVGLRKNTADEIEWPLAELAETAIEEIGRRPRDRNKRQARDRIIRLATVFDSLARVNRGAKQAISVGAINDLRKRTFDIKCIEPQIVFRRTVTLAVIAEMETYLKGVHDFLDLIFQPENDLAKKMSVVSFRRSVDRQLTFYLARLSRFDIAPFYQTADYLQKEFSLARRLMSGGRLPEAAAELKRSWNSLKLRLVRSELEEVITRLTTMLFSPEEIDRLQFDEVILRLQKQANSLRKADETGFRRPVASQAIVSLEIAEAFLLQRTAAALKQAKQAAKDSAALL